MAFLEIMPLIVMLLVFFLVFVAIVGSIAIILKTIVKKRDGGSEDLKRRIEILEKEMEVLKNN